MAVYDKIASDQGVSLMDLSDCPLSDVACLCLQTTTLTWLGSVSSHQGACRAASVCRKEAHRGRDVTQRKPIRNTKYWQNTTHNKGVMVLCQIFKETMTQYFILMTILRN